MIFSKLYDENYRSVTSEYFTTLRTNERRTVEEVANAVGLKVSTYYHYEKGLRDMPISTFIALCEYYKKDYAEIFRYFNDETTARTLRAESHKNEQ